MAMTLCCFGSAVSCAEQLAQMTGDDFFPLAKAVFLEHFVLRCGIALPLNDEARARVIEAQATPVVKEMNQKRAKARADGVPFHPTAFSVRAVYLQVYPQYAELERINKVVLLPRTPLVDKALKKTGLYQTNYTAAFVVMAVVAEGVEGPLLMYRLFQAAISEPAMAPLFVDLTARLAVEANKVTKVDNGLFAQYLLDCIRLEIWSAVVYRGELDWEPRLRAAMSMAVRMLDLKMIEEKDAKFLVEHLIYDHRTDPVPDLLMALCHYLPSVAKRIDPSERSTFYLGTYGKLARLSKDRRLPRRHRLMMRNVTDAR
jgi:hypothetical protein